MRCTNWFLLLAAVATLATTFFVFDTRDDSITIIVDGHPYQTRSVIHQATGPHDRDAISIEMKPK